jgi:hypothetical protein
MKIHRRPMSKLAEKPTAIYHSKYWVPNSFANHEVKAPDARTGGPRSYVAISCLDDRPSNRYNLWGTRQVQTNKPKCNTTAIVCNITITNQWRIQEFFSEGIFARNFLGGGGGSKNSVDDRGRRERRSGGCSPLVRGSTQFANEWNPCYY